MIGLQCLTCVHFHEKGLPGGFSGCEAFPEGIPFEIQTGDVDHSRPYPGDNGIRYEPKPGIGEIDMSDGQLVELGRSNPDEPLI